MRLNKSLDLVRLVRRGRAFTSLSRILLSRPERRLLLHQRRESVLQKRHTSSGGDIKSTDDSDIPDLDLIQSQQSDNQLSRTQFLSYNQKQLLVNNAIMQETNAQTEHSEKQQQIFALSNTADPVDSSLQSFEQPAIKVKTRKLHSQFLRQQHKRKVNWANKIRYKD